MYNICRYMYMFMDISMYERMHSIIVNVKRF